MSADETAGMLQMVQSKRDVLTKPCAWQAVETSTMRVVWEIMMTSMKHLQLSRLSYSSQVIN